MQTRRRGERRSQSRSDGAEERAADEALRARGDAPKRGGGRNRASKAANAGASAAHKSSTSKSAATKSAATKSAATTSEAGKNGANKNGVANSGVGKNGATKRGRAKSGAASVIPARRLRLTRSVALVGLMGAGKSAVGRRLAGALGRDFRDSDDEIVKAAALSIPEIFERFGEPYFREGERRVIARLLADPPHVLATGGGAFMDPRTRGVLENRAFTIWLRADLETLVARCSRRDNRPLLKSGDLRETLARLIDERYPVYAEADVAIDTGEGPHENVVERAVAELKRASVLT